MLLNKKLVLLLCWLNVTSAFAQKHNALYAEGLGTGLTGTINYDFRFKDDIITGNFKDALGLRFGVGLSPKYIYDVSVAMHPVATGGTKPLVLLGVNTFQDLSYCKCAGDDIEFGANLLYAPKNSIADKWGTFKQTDRFIPSINIGYRRQKDEYNGIVLRLCYNPYFLDGKLHQWLGVSVGYHFN
ncbi:hypothetical protein [Ferruginibacter sp.]